MCRIAGIIDSSSPLTESKKWVGAMCTCMQHGGPDDEGMFSDADVNLVFGNRRLALVDLTAAGHQPMHYLQRYTITFNGEIYNFRSIRKELQTLGHQFVSHTDTEVVLAAFAQWNVQSFEKFNGMFAFALWDNKEKDLYLVRDSVGMKPLYYSQITGGIAFSSEIRALQQLPMFKTDNANWPVYLMAYGHIPEPVTTLETVTPLHKGCFLKYNVSSGISILQSFRHFSYTENNLSHTGAPGFSELLYTAVERHLDADAPIGVFLSGGLDSSVLASVAAGIGKSSINTLSLYFDEEKYSEKHFQDLLLKKIQSHSFQHLLLESEFQQSFPQILEHMDMPCSDGINTWFISKYAKQKGLKAVLSGIGADELFGGYPSFDRIKFSRMMKKFPSMMYTSMRKSNRKVLNRMAYLQMDGMKGIYLFLRGHFTPHEIAKQLDASEKEIWDILNDLPVVCDAESLSLKNQASWMEFNLYMQNQLLRDADVMGMIHGVEIRIPFLDTDVIEYATSLPSSEKYYGTKRKQFLIDEFNQLLPREIWDRPKMGFSFPFQQWLRHSSFVIDAMNTSREITKTNFDKFNNGELHWSHMMSLIILQNKGLA